MLVWLNILRRGDGSYYVGVTRDALEHRLAEHQAGVFDGYTARRRPVSLVFQRSFDRIDDAIAAERQITGWRRAKKEALISGNLGDLPALARRKASSMRSPVAIDPSRRAPAGRSSG